MPNDSVKIFHSSACSASRNVRALNRRAQHAFVNDEGDAVIDANGHRVLR